MLGDIQIFTGRANPGLAHKICDYLGQNLREMETSEFPDGECRVAIKEDVRGQDVFLIQSTCPPVNDTLMELLIMVDACRRASATRITAVIPYFGYARQDRKHEGRVPITAKLVANMLEAAGVHRVLTIDLHATQIQGFFDIPVDNLFAAPVLINYIKSLNLNNPVLLAPDVGSVKRTGAYASKLGMQWAVIDKKRTSAEDAEVNVVIGEVKDQDVIMVDDMISTAGTICKAANTAKEMGSKDVYVCATHPVFSGPAFDRIESAPIKHLAVTDTIPPHNNGQIEDKITIVSIAELLGEAIRRIHEHRSVSSLFV